MGFHIYANVYPKVAKSLAKYMGNHGILQDVSRMFVRNIMADWW
jgi:hypothetical protein